MDKMKFKYYLDTTLLFCMIMMLLITISDISRWSNLIIYVGFLLLSIFVNLRLRIVLKYSFEGQPTFAENARYLAWIIGKLLYLLSLTALLLEGAELKSTLLLVVFAIDSYNLLNLNYVSQDHLIIHLSKVVALSDISACHLLKRSMEYYHCQLTLKNGEVMKLFFSKSVFEKLSKSQDCLANKEYGVEN